MEEVINLSFTVNAALDAFNAKLIKGKVFTAGTASAMTLAKDLEGTWVDLNLGTNGPLGKTTYIRKGITLRANTDPTAFNFSNDNRLPPKKDAGSIAYSEAGVATLGGSVYGNPNGEEEEDGVTILDDNGSDGSGVSLSSDESDLWNQNTGTPGVINNMTDLLSEKKANEEEIAMLSRRIAMLQRSIPIETPVTATTSVYMDTTEENVNTGSRTISQGTDSTNTDSQTKLDGDDNMAPTGNSLQTGIGNEITPTEMGNMPEPTLNHDVLDIDNQGSRPQQQQEGESAEDGGHN